MEDKKDNSVQLKRLASDSEYFNNVFKRTEKLVSVIFYILSHTDKVQNIETQLELLKDKTIKVHEASLGTLSLQQHNKVEGLSLFQQRLLELESILRVTEVTQVIPQNIHQMLYEQIDLVQRFISNHYTKEENFVFDTQVKDEKTLSAPKKKAGQRRQRVSVPAGDISTDAYLVHSQLTDRAERIKTVLEAKPQATVKDIAEVVTDVSEKTIQRELNSLIEKGQVEREGERRWSKYSVIKT